MSLEVTIDFNTKEATKKIDELDKKITQTENAAHDTFEIVGGIINVSMGMMQAVMSATGIVVDQVTQAIFLTATSVASFLTAIASALTATTFGMAEAARLAIATVIFSVQMIGIMTQQNQAVGALAMGANQLNMILGMIGR